MDGVVCVKICSLVNPSRSGPLLFALVLASITPLPRLLDSGPKAVFSDWAVCSGMDVLEEELEILCRVGSPGSDAGIGTASETTNTLL